jgi:hypothetical protein
MRRGAPTSTSSSLWWLPVRRVGLHAPRSLSGVRAHVRAPPPRLSSWIVPLVVRLPGVLTPSTAPCTARIAGMVHPAAW